MNIGGIDLVVKRDDLLYVAVDDEFETSLNVTQVRALLVALTQFADAMDDGILTKKKMKLDALKSEVTRIQNEIKELEK